MAVEGNVGLAFGLVIAAGLCTTIGACIAFCTKVTDHRMLAAALGISAGVMMYVSFVEIFTAKSVNGFVSANYTEAEAYRYATFTFFGGMVFTWLLDRLSHGIMHMADRCSSSGPEASGGSQDSTGTANPKVLISPCACSAAAAALPMPPAPGMAPQQQEASKDDDVELAVVASHPACAAAGAAEQPVSDGQRRAGEPPGNVADQHATSLARMGLLSCLAVGIHNFPEGLATFVGTLADPKAGVAIAVAIALHNIPEGIVVAMPIYYASGSKWRGFLWSTVSGLSEPLGALLGWLILRGRESDPMMYAIMFGIVAGMMVYISLHELIPTALRYDPGNRYTTRFATLGMVVMAASLLLFQA